ncbi:MAG: hypothetical protein KFW09_04590 [Oscillospiraceae bacterium]|nr:hypothetical protein [Oscillospiraceae bacterium]
MEAQKKPDLNSIEDVEEKIILKEVLNNIFSNLQTTTGKYISNLQNRVYDELLFEDLFSLYTTIASKDDYDLSNKFFFPLDNSKLNDPVFNLDDIKNSVSRKKPHNIFDVYIDCSYEDFYDIISSDREFTGIISTDIKEYKATFILRQNFSYIKIVEELYNIFISNSVDWKTINFPYIWRFADVVILRYDNIYDHDDIGVDLNHAETIKSISIDFEEFSSIIKYGMVPLWNLSSNNYTLSSSPIPVGEIVNYEHKIDISQLDNAGGVLLELGNYTISNIRRNNYDIVVSIKESKLDWILYNIVPISVGISDFGYPIFSNGTTDSYSNSFSTMKSKNIKTKAELFKLVNSYELKSFVVFKDFEIQQNYDYDSLFLNLNYFIEDNIRDMSSKNTMILKFIKVNTKNKFYFYEDIINFIVSEIQLYFPEFKCVGEVE